jgi:succinoglycan biosynthesis protein ExoA
MNLPVTIILPTLNERSHIRDCLDSLNSQDYPNILEILVIDGGSTDGTRDIVESEGGKVRLIDNPRMTAAAAMNIGIDFCTTDVFVRVDAHTLYSKNYVSQSVETFLDSGAQVVGGPMRPVGTNPFGRAVAAVTTSPLGVGPGRFHYSEICEEVETVYLGIFDKEFVLMVGGYDETSLQWAAEDQELNFRIRKAGGRIILDPKIRSTYFPRNTARALARQYHNYGMCKASTLKKHRSLPSWRPLAPALMVLCIPAGVAAGGALGNWWAAGILLLVHPVGASALGSFRRVRKSATLLNFLLALEICHWSYGLGFWRGLGRIATSRPFDNRPKKGRR